MNSGSACRSGRVPAVYNPSGQRLQQALLDGRRHLFQHQRGKLLGRGRHGANATQRTDTHPVGAQPCRGKDHVIVIFGCYAQCVAHTDGPRNGILFGVRLGDVVPVGIRSRIGKGEQEKENENRPERS